MNRSAPLRQPCAHPDAPVHHTTTRTRDGYAHICTEVPAQQEWIDALLLAAEGLSTKSVDQGAGDDRGGSSG